MWLVSKCHLSVSLSLSLSLSLSSSHSASSSFTFSRILFIQGYLCWSRLAYLSQESSQILYQVVPSVFQTPIKNDSIFPKITPLFVWRYSTLHSVALSYHGQPFTLTDNHPICTAFYMVTDLTHRSTSFQPPTHKGPSENSLLCSTPTCGIRSVRLLVRWISRLFLRGVRT